MEFEDWLASEDLSPSTIKKYVGAITGSLTTWAIENNITSKSLIEVSDHDEFEAISELIGETEIFAERNSRGNHMYGAALNQYARYLARDGVDAQDVNPDAGLYAVQMAHVEQAEIASTPFEPNDKVDARERVLRAIVRRRGQPKFRADLIVAYEGRCAITECAVLPILEAAHVTPYLGPHTNTITNGLLLRADIHTLWDLGLIAIDPSSMTVVISSTLHDPGYQSLDGRAVFQPIAKASRLSPPALFPQWNALRTHLNKGR